MDEKKFQTKSRLMTSLLDDKLIELRLFTELLFIAQ